MKKVINFIEWKFLLGVFKCKRIVNAFFSKRSLDFDSNLLIRTKTLREYTTRARSCAKEPETCAWLKNIAKEGSVLYDVGANVGAYSLIGASLGMRVYAFEPSPENYATLNENAKLNNLDKAIVPLPFVLGNKNKEIEFSVDDNSSGATATFIDGVQKDGIREYLPMLRLDELISLLDVPIPHAIKIDVDGAEVEVLKGSAELLKNQKLIDILVEVEDGLLSDVRDILTKNGFKEIEKHERHKGVYNLIFKRV